MADPEDEEEVDQDALAAEWAAMADEDEDADALAADWEASLDGDGESGVNDRELNQNEIDSLLGVTDDGGATDNSGILALVNSNDITYERLPMLEVVFDRLERMLTTSVRNFTSENVDINLDAITAQRFGDYLNSVPLPAMISVFKAVEWDNYGLVTVDSPLIYSIVDVLLGGRRGTAPMRIEGRPYTTIEATLVQRLIRLILHDLSAAFQPITPVEFRFERMETNPRFAAIARPGNAAVVFKLRIDMEDRGGIVEFLIPYATLEPARDLLLQMFMGEKFGRDSIWETHLAREMWMTDVELKAVLDQQTIALGDVMRFRVGSVLHLATRPDSPVEIKCGEVPMMVGKLGRVGDNISVLVEDIGFTQRPPPNPTDAKKKGEAHA